MYDVFVFDHREFTFADGAPSGLQNIAFLVAEELTTAPLHLPNFFPINRRHTLENQICIAHDWLERVLKNQPRLWTLERLLVEAILLNRAMHMLMSAESASMLSAPLGVMIQQRLTLIFSVVNQSQWSRIHGMHQLAGVNSEQWKRHIAGADAAAYVLTTLAHRDTARVFLPSPSEDATAGVDLFWFEHPFRIAVSVKCIQGHEVHAWHWMQRELADPVQMDMKRLLRGLYHIQMTPGIDMEPVVVYVGKMVGSPLCAGNFEEAWVDEILGYMHDRRRRGILSLVREPLVIR